MIYFAIVHWKFKLWMRIQLNHIQNFTPEPYRIYCYSTGIDFKDYLDKFYFIENTEIKQHSVKLNILAKKIINDGKDEDLLIFFDGDAFPISEYLPFIKNKIRENKLVAIRRDENKDIFPHPSFCATTIGFWKKINGTWDKSKIFSLNGRIIEDIGSKLYKLLLQRGIDWYPLLRTNKKNFHKVFFGVYGNTIYHHGAGFRYKQAWCRYDLMKYNLLLDIVNKIPLFRWKLNIVLVNFIRSYHMKRNYRLISNAYKMIKEDDFFNKLL